MTRDEVAASVAATFYGRVSQALSRQPRFAVAVPGGSVATTVLPRFATLNLDWVKLDVTLVDERIVPVSDPDSNLNAVRSMWLTLLEPQRPRVIAPPVEPRDGHSGNASAIAAQWQRELVEALGTPPRLDLAILGMGPDGHVASLFPRHPLLASRGAWTAGVTDSPKPPPGRVTLTLETLAAAAELWVIAFGREKAAAVAEARTNPASELPVALAARAHHRVVWFLDDAAEGR